MSRQVDPIPKSPRVVKARKPVRRTKAGTPAALKRKATKLWGEYVHARDRVCQVCGRADGKLDAHHVMVRTHTATRSDENNGMLVCYRDHQKLHSDPHFAVQVYYDRYGTDGYRELREKAYAGTNGKYPAAYWQAELERLTALLERVS